MLDKTLSNGYTLPHMAIGTKLDEKERAGKNTRFGNRSRIQAFDTARDYGSEDVVGDAVKESLAIQGSVEKMCLSPRK